MNWKSKLFWITTLWIITLIILVISLTTSVFLTKPKYTCYGDECNILTDYFIPKCIDSTITGNDIDMLITFDITNMIETCQIEWTVEETNTDDFKKGDSMLCDIPMEVVSDEEKYGLEFLNYCEGSMKDSLTKMPI